MLGNNMFAYCGNNPVCYIDPSGYISDSITGVPSKFGLLTDYGKGSSGGGGGGIVVPGLGQALLETLSSIADGIKRLVTEQKILIVIIQDQEHTYKQKQKQSYVYDYQKKTEYQYWEASRESGNVVVGQGLSLAEASIRVASGLDIMCANEGAARWLLILNGYWNHTDPEIHGKQGYYWHYHPNRHSKVHIWYYS